MNQPLRSRRTAGMADAESFGVRGAPARRGAPGPRSPHHLVVVEKPISRLRSGPARARLLLGAGAVLAVVVAFALVYLHVNMAQRQFQLDRLSTQVTNQQAAYSRLRLQVAELESPQQIIATAEGKLGMRQPSSVRYLSPSSPLPAGGTATTGGPAGASAGSTSADKAGTTAAPAGDADWPMIKSQLAGSP